MPIICKWEKTQEGWKLWKKGKPKVCGTGPTYEEAWEELLKALPANGISILENMPIEYDKPLPPTVEAEKYMKPELYILSGAEQFQAIRARGPEDYYENGECLTCSSPVGKRTDVNALCYCNSKDDAVYSRLGSLESVYIYSEDFLSLLTTEEKARFVLRPVEFHSLSPKPKCNYYELLADSPIPFVGVSCYESNGISCRTCGQIDIKYHSDIGHSPLNRYICKTDLADPLPSCFPVGSETKPFICVTRERWDQIRGHKFTKGLTSKAIGVVPENLCERQPDQQNSCGICDVCQNWRKPKNEKGERWPTFKPPYNQPHVIENFEWIRQAEQNSLLEIVRATKDYEEILEIIKSGKKPDNNEYLGFRCTDCRILGYVRMDSEEICFGW